MPDAVLMPVFNEAGTIEGVLDSVRDHYSGEILIVNDGSTDDTNLVLATRRDVTVIANPHNMGYGRALVEGFAVARAQGFDHVVTMDCDGQHEPKHIPQFLGELELGGDIISGSRYLPGSRVIGAAPPSRREINQRVAEEINRVTGWDLTDAFCGFKAYRLSALEGIDIREPGYAMPLELWAKAFRRGRSVREIPVERIYCSHDRSFGEALDDPETRYAYYMRVWHEALGEER